MVLLVQADGVADRARVAQVVGDHRVEVVDVAEAVAAQLQGVGVAGEHVLAAVEVVLPEPHRRRVGVGHDHLRDRGPVADRAVVEGDLVQGQTLALVEPDAQVPLAPADAAVGDGERAPLGLGDLDRPQRGHVLALHGRVVEVPAGRGHRDDTGVDHPVDRAGGEVDVGDEPVDGVRPGVVGLVVLAEPEGPGEPAALLPGDVVDTGRERHRAHRGGLQPALLQRGEPVR